MSTRRNFDDWIRCLDDEVIQGEYGYERGEFAVFPDHWRPMFRKGLTPQQAFPRALDAFADERKREDEERQANWQRIQEADAAFRTAPVPTPNTSPERVSKSEDL